MIVATLGEKGGTGKTTLATNLAGMRSTKFDVVLIDADRQATASVWVEQRAQHADLPLPAYVQRFGRGLSRTIMEMASRYDDVIVDVASGDSIELYQALESVDVAVLPVQPSGPDIWTVGPMEKRIDDALARNEVLQALAVLSRASPNPRSRETSAARKALSKTRTIISQDCPTLHERVAFKRAVAQGRTVWEYQPRDDRACQEVLAVYRQVFKQPYGEEEIGHD